MHNLPLFQFSKCISASLDEFLPAITHAFQGLMLKPSASTTSTEKACFCHAEANLLSVSAVSYGRPLEAFYDMPTGMPVISVVTQGRASYRWGHGAHASIARVNFLPANTHLSMRFSPDCCQILIRLNPIEELKNVYHAVLQQGPQNRLLQQVIQYRVNKLVRNVHFATSFVQSREIMKSFEHQMFDLLMNHSEGLVSEEHKEDPHLRDDDILKTIDYMHQHPQWEFDIAELAREVHASVRSYYSHFKRMTGSTPYQYYLALHLSRVRVALLQKRGSDTISDIAMAHGFYHLSRFSSQYRELFGELPSETSRHVEALLAGNRGSSAISHAIRIPE